MKDMSQNVYSASGGIEALKRQFLEYMEIEKGRALNTVANYDRYITRFIEVSHVKTAESLTEEKVREFRLWLNRKNLAKNTQNYYVIALRTFLKYLFSREIPTLAPNKIELAKTGQRELDLISNEELGRLLAAPDISRETGRRDRAVLELLFSSGLRVSELCSLTEDTLSRLSLRSEAKGDESFSVRGKGGKVRVVFVSDTAKSALKAYLNKRKDIAGESLFGITPRSVQRLIKHYAIKAGISRKVSPHTLRHSFATDLLNNGADIRSVQALLGHANITTTQIYTHVTDSHLRDIHRKYHSPR